MTPQDHNKFLGLAHIAYCGFHVLLAVGFTIFFWALFRSMPPARGGGDDLPDFFFLLMAGFMFFFYGVMTAPSLIAGIGLLKRNRGQRPGQSSPA